MEFTTGGIAKDSVRASLAYERRENRFMISSARPHGGSGEWLGPARLAGRGRAGPRLLINRSRRFTLARLVSLGIKVRNGEVFAGRGKGLFCLSILKANARAPVSLLDPPVILAFPRNTGCFCTQLIQLPAVGSYNQTIGFGHGNTSERNSNKMDSAFVS
jgi:hypothetical protein